MIVHVMAGNSDDKLTQAEWAELIDDIDQILARAFETWAGQLHGRWFAAPDVPWQSVCWCVDLAEQAVPEVMLQLSRVAHEFRQDAIAWHQVHVVHMIEPGMFTERRP